MSKKYLLKADPTLTGTTKATGTTGIAGTCLTCLTKARPCSEVWASPLPSYWYFCGQVWLLTQYSYFLFMVTIKCKTWNPLRFLLRPLSIQVTTINLFYFFWSFDIFKSLMYLTFMWSNIVLYSFLRWDVESSSELSNLWCMSNSVS